MKLNELLLRSKCCEDQLNESSRVWIKKDGKLLKMYRCEGGERNGHLVSDPLICHKQIQDTKGN